MSYEWSVTQKKKKVISFMCVIYGDARAVQYIYPYNSESTGLFRFLSHSRR